MTSVFMETIYCDDVRSEIGNKLSFMGIYGPNILLTEFPAVLAKFCVVMSLHMPADTKAQAVTFSLFKDDEEIGRSTALIADVRKAAPEPSEPDDDLRMTIRFIAQMTPLQIQGPCRLKARADVDGQTVKGGSLRVDRTPAGFVP